MIQPARRYEETPTFRELLEGFAEDVAALIHDEIDLVSRETRSELRTGLTVLGVLVVCGVTAILTLCAAAVLALARVVDPPIAALIVGGVLAVIAAGAAVYARKHVKQMDLIPEDTLKTLT